MIHLGWRYSLLVGFKDIRTGDTLTENAPIVLESMDFPDPVIGIVEPKTQKDMDKLGELYQNS